MTVGAGLANADALDDVTKAGTIRIGIFEDFPPFASLGSDMKIQGYDVDMANALAKALGVKAELVGITGRTHPVPQRRQGRCAAEHRLQRRARQGGRFHRSLRALLHRGHGPGRGAGERRGRPGRQDHRRQSRHPRGYRSDEGRSAADADIQRYNDYNGVISAFLSGQAQLMVVGKRRRRHHPGEKPGDQAGGEVRAADLAVQTWAVKKGESRLQQKLNETLVGMRRDGTLNEIGAEVAETAAAHRTSKPGDQTHPWVYELDFSGSPLSGLFLHGAGVTLGLTAIAATLGIALSIGGAATARWGLRWPARWSRPMSILIRNTPFLVQLSHLFRPARPRDQDDGDDAAIWR